jgi:hypothetical protein
VSRRRLPVPQPDKVNINVWSYLKQCVGKELSKVRCTAVSLMSSLVGKPSVRLVFRIGIGSSEPDPRRVKWHHEKGKKNKFCVLRRWMFFLEAFGTCFMILKVHHGGLNSIFSKKFFLKKPGVWIRTTE